MQILFLPFFFQNYEQITTIHMKFFFYCSTFMVIVDTYGLVEKILRQKYLAALFLLNYCHENKQIWSSNKCLLMRYIYLVIPGPKLVYFPSTVGYLQKFTRIGYYISVRHSSWQRCITHKIKTRGIGKNLPFYIFFLGGQKWHTSEITWA